MKLILKLAGLLVMLLASVHTVCPISAEEKATMTAKDDWKDKLTPEQYNVCHDGGTESPFSGKYVDHHEKGIYTCVVCGNKLFSSETKFESGTGWPSFYDIENSSSVTTHEDRSHGMTRIEVLCGQCGAHLGHVFPDGPKPTGKRYCINSVALDHVSESSVSESSVSDKKTE